MIGEDCEEIGARCKGGECRQGEDGIMTGLSAPNAVCGGGEEAEEDPKLSNERLGSFFIRSGL